MNTFSAFRFAARTLLHPPPPVASSSCLRPISLARIHVRHKSKFTTVRLRNENIPYEEVSVVEDGVLVKVSLRRLLASINHKEELVELVAKDPQPVVKIVNKKQDLQRAKKAKVRQREVAKRNLVKEVKLTWGSEQSDMDHKLSQMRAYLEEGARVDINFSVKTRTPAPAVKTQQEKVQSTIALLADVAGVCKPTEWKRNTATIYLKGIEKEGAAEDSAATADTVSDASAQEEGAPKPQLAPKSEAAPKPDAAARENIVEPSKYTKSAPPHQLPPQSGAPPKAKDFVDLSSYGYMKPAVRNPLAGMKREKKYGNSKRPTS